MSLVITPCLWLDVVRVLTVEPALPFTLTDGAAAVGSCFDLDPDAPFPNTSPFFVDTPDFDFDLSLTAVTPCVKNCRTRCGILR